MAAAAGSPRVSVVAVAEGKSAARGKVVGALIGPGLGREGSHGLWGAGGSPRTRH